MGRSVRLITIKGPKESARKIAAIAFSAGIPEVCVHQVCELRDGQPDEIKDTVKIATATPTAKAFVDELMEAPFFNRRQFSIAIKQPRSIIADQHLSETTSPLVEPTVDILEELWQFSHITFGFIGRIFIGALLLGYGLIEYNLLFMIAGLLFIPLLPPMLAIGFGMWTHQFRLARQGLFAFLAATTLLVCGGVLVALMMNGPLRYNESTSLLTGLLISLAVGVAAGLATADDVGRREMIGLAATSQIAILPVWFGICFIFGFPTLNSMPPTWRALSLLVNAANIVLASMVTYAVLGMAPLASLRRSTQASGEAGPSVSVSTT